MQPVWIGGTTCPVLSADEEKFDIGHYFAHSQQKGGSIMKTQIRRRQTAAAYIASWGFVLAAASAAAPNNKSPNQLTESSVPGAGGTCALPGTVALREDAAGTIMGSYCDAGNVTHGFLRNPDGSFTSFDAPGAGTGAGQGTTAYGLNWRGDHGVLS